MRDVAKRSAMDWGFITYGDADGKHDTLTSPQRHLHLRRNVAGVGTQDIGGTWRRKKKIAIGPVRPEENAEATRASFILAVTICTVKAYIIGSYPSRADFGLLDEEFSDLDDSGRDTGTVV